MVNINYFANNDIRTIARNLYRAAENMHLAIGQYRTALEQVAGCDLSEWGLEELDQYYNLLPEDDRR